MPSHLDTKVLYCADNLKQLSDFPSDSVDLIYLDPPFFSNRRYEVIWGDEAEIRSFEDRWEGGLQVYTNWMRDRVIEMHRVLRSTGALYLHCDPHASHYLKVMLDGVFGPENFRNEVVWKRSHGHNSAKRYGPAHDVIFFYGKSKSATWNNQYQDYGADYIEKHFRHVDTTGRRYKHENPTGAGTREGATGQPWRGINPTAKGRHWARPPEELDELDKAGRIHWPRTDGAWPYIKLYLDERLGMPLQDVWVDINPINMVAAERLGYPTQKPEALLERIILSSSNEDDVVLDPFCGCGTTVAVAERLRRRWIGIDISPTAVELMKRRITKVSRGQCAPEVIGLPVTEDDLRHLKPFEFQNWVIQRFNGTHSPRKSGDGGIDGYSFMVHDPIQVKQSESVGRNVVDNFETAMDRVGKDKGYIVAFSFTKGAREEVARARWHKKLEIQLVTIAQLLVPIPEQRGPLIPVPASVTDLPLPPSRPRDARPSAAELVESDIQSG